MLLWEMWHLRARRRKQQRQIRHHLTRLARGPSQLELKQKVELKNMRIKSKNNFIQTISQEGLITSDYSTQCGEKAERMNQYRMNFEG